MGKDSSAPLTSSPAIAEVVRDPATVSADGTPLAQLPEGVTFYNVPTHIDDRGSVFEMFDTRWNWHPEPINFVYSYSLRPGKVKGWGLHKEHENRYFVLSGEMQIVMYDEREGSSTYQQLSKVVLSHFNRRIMNIPAGIWHANENIGTQDVVVVNFPTKAYDHEKPDKFRLPLDTDKIPYTFERQRGW